MDFNFCAHILGRMMRRSIAEFEIIDAVKMPDITIKKNNRYYARKDLQRGTIEVVYEKTERYISLITVYWV